MDSSNPLYVHPSDGPGSLPMQEKLVGAQNYRSWRRSMEIGLSTKRKLGFVKGTIPKPPSVPIAPVTVVENNARIEMWETCNNLVISWIMSSVSDSIAKSVMFIGSASEIWSQLETRFSLSNGSRKYKLSKDTFGISQQGSSVSEYYTKMKCVWEELDSMNNLPRLTAITQEMSVFLNAVEKQKEEQRLFQFLNGLDECYGPQRSQLLLINPLPSVACAVIQQEELQKDVFHGSTIVESTALFSKNGGKDKYSICGFKWHPPERCWEKSSDDKFLQPVPVPMPTHPAVYDICKPIAPNNQNVPIPTPETHPEPVVPNTQDVPAQPEVRRSSRTSKPPAWAKDFVTPTVKPSANQVTAPILSSQFKCFLSNLISHQDPKGLDLDINWVSVSLKKRWQESRSKVGLGFLNASMRPSGGFCLSLLGKIVVDLIMVAEEAVSDNDRTV
ncbi:hypothetical protein CTI12_AA178300 [Artemisia annua]|uniref:Retrotransposon Copia-like N-terminal domain-containing protein n=1 Tax=Artemisia annua TaxID=35608 RepID=A0A2U1P9P7_ARTAN|nr:hypothetical protein CTI12_AA178300 [Artemisia annua]